MHRADEMRFVILMHQPDELDSLASNHDEMLNLFRPFITARAAQRLYSTRSVDSAVDRVLDALEETIDASPEKRGELRERCNQAINDLIGAFHKDLKLSL